MHAAARVTPVTDDGVAPLPFTWKRWAEDSVPSPNLIRVCVQVPGEVQNMSYFEVEGAGCF